MCVFVCLSVGEEAQSGRKLFAALTTPKKLAPISDQSRPTPHASQGSGLVCAPPRPGGVLSAFTGVLHRFLVRRKQRPGWPHSPLH